MPVLQTTSQPDINHVRAGPRGNTPIVFLHALGLDLSLWEHQFEAFSGEHDVIALDLPGHGLSATPDTAPGFASMAQTVSASLARLTPGPVHLVGISVGAMIAQTIALAAPQLISSLALVATSCTFAEPVRKILQERAGLVRRGGMAAITPLHLERWFPRQFRERRPDLLDRLGKILLRQDGEFHASMWDMVAGLDTADRLAALRCPVMVIAGAQDSSASPEAGQLIASRIEGASLHVIAGCGHFPPLESPVEFNALLRELVNP